MRWSPARVVVVALATVVLVVGPLLSVTVRVLDGELGVVGAVLSLLLAAVVAYWYMVGIIRFFRFRDERGDSVPSPEI